MKIGIVGGGVSGLVALKCCKEEGLQAICFEMTNQIGGLWSPHKPVYGLSHCYDSLITNTSKELSAFSDHPFPAEDPTFLPRELVYEYLQSYSERFDLAVDIRLEHKVHSVQKTEDHETSGCWQITVEDLKTGHGKVTHRFDAVMICTGIYSHPYTPNIHNVEQFNGIISHSHAYTSHKDYGIDERVMVVGNRSSGLDIATNLANRQSKPVYLSARSPVFAMKRDYGHPWDAQLTLFVATMARWLPWLYKRLVRIAVASSVKRFSKVDNWLNATDASEGALSDEIICCLEEGKIMPVAAISEFTERGVKLSDGVEVEVERVVMATGYRLTFPFLNKDILSEDQWHVYKRVWPVHLHKNSLALIGCVRAAGSILPLSELQARWAVQVFKGHSNIPSNVELKYRTPVLVPDGCQPIIPKLRVESLSYAVELAGYIGCYPSVGLILAHPLRWFSTYFGPLYPYVFRLSGPGKSSDAWRFITTARSRIHPSQQEVQEEKKRCKRRNDNSRIFGSISAGGAAYMCFSAGMLLCALQVTYLLCTKLYDV